MRQLFSIFCFFLSLSLYGQNLNKPVGKSYVSLPGVTVLFDIKASDLIGEYHNTDGFTGYTMNLKNNHYYEKSGRDCISRSKWDSGSWSIKNGNTVIINSNKGRTHYDLIKLDRYCFLIPLIQREKFIKDFNLTRSKFRNSKPFERDGKWYTIDWLVAYYLIKLYYGKLIDE